MTERENLKYQELEGLNLVLDIVFGIEPDTIDMYEVVEEFEDGATETKSFSKYDSALSYFDKYIEMVF